MVFCSKNLSNCVHMGANLWRKNGDASTDWCDAYGDGKSWIYVKLTTTMLVVCFASSFCCCPTLGPNMHRLSFNCFDGSVVGYCWSAALNYRHRLKRRNFSSSLSNLWPVRNDCSSDAVAYFYFERFCAANFPFARSILPSTRYYCRV